MWLCYSRVPSYKYIEKKYGIQEDVEGSIRNAGLAEEDDMVPYLQRSGVHGSTLGASTLASVNSCYSSRVLRKNGLTF